MDVVTLGMLIAIALIAAWCWWLTNKAVDIEILERRIEKQGESLRHVSSRLRDCDSDVQLTWNYFRLKRVHNSPLLVKKKKKEA